jgi:hypothetical protein
MMRVVYWVDWLDNLLADETVGQLAEMESWMAGRKEYSMVVKKEELSVVS